MPEEVLGLARRVRESREKLGWSQEELGERAGLSRAWVSLVELGKITDPKVGTIAHCAAALKTTPEYLLYGTVPADSPDVKGAA